MREKQGIDGFMDAVGLQMPRRREEHKAAGCGPDRAGRGKVAVAKPAVERLTAGGGSGSSIGSLRGTNVCGGSGRNAR